MKALAEDVDLSFIQLEFCIRTMCYAELEKFDVQVFGQDLQINLLEENVVFSSGEFNSLSQIIQASQMTVGTAFAATAICLESLLEFEGSGSEDLIKARCLIKAVRNAFSHGISAPTWFVKPHNFQKIDLAFVGGPIVDLQALNKQSFNYSQIGGLAVWIKLKDYVLSCT